jgi:hypothetical protein
MSPLRTQVIFDTSEIDARINQFARMVVESVDTRRTLTCKGDPVAKRLEEYLNDFIDVDPVNHSGFILSAALENRHDMYVLQDDNLQRKTTRGKRWARRCVYKDSDYLVQLLDSECSPSGVPLLDFFDLAVPRTSATKSMFAAMIRAHREQSGAELREWAELWGGKWESTGTPGRFFLALPPWSPLVKRSAITKWLGEVVGTCEHAPVCRFANRTGPKDDSKDHAGRKAMSALSVLLPFEFALVENEEASEASTLKFKISATVQNSKLNLKIIILINILQNE